MKLLKDGSELLEDPYSILEKVGVPEDQVSLLRNAKKLCDAFYDNPETAVLEFMTLEQQELYHTGKTMMDYYNDPMKAITKASGCLENALPEKYKVHAKKIN